MLFSNFKKALLFAVPLPFIVTLVSPVSFYLHNNTEYSVQVSALLPILLICFLGMAGFLFVLLMAIKKRLWSTALKGVLVALAVAGWVQSQLLAWDFGPLDGRGIDWTAWVNHAYFEILLWAVMIAVILYLAFRKEKLFEAATQGIIFLGVMTLASSWLTSDYKPKQDAGREVASPFFFHPANNKIVIVMDSYQSDIFGEIAKRWPDDVSFLRGFTFYPNTLGGCWATTCAASLILTGQFYKNEIPYKDWIEKNNAKLNIADYFAARGYGVTLVSQANDPLLGIRSPKFTLNSLRESGFSGRLISTVFVLDGGAFRGLPIALKKSLCGDSKNWIFVELIKKAMGVPPIFHGDDLIFVQRFEREAAIGSDKDAVFRYYHLWGPHAPLQINAKYEYVKNMPNTRESLIQQSRGTLSLLKRLLQRLRDLQIYETAEILVIGDHGSREFRPTDLINEQSIGEGLDDNVLRYARPLFLYKPAKVTAALSYSDAPMHLEDVVCILSDNAFPNCTGFSLFDKTNTRKRIFYGANFTEKYSNKYMFPMIEYVVKGDVRDLSAWRNTYIEYSEGTSRRLPKTKPSPAQ